LEKGVYIPCPQAVEVGEDINPGRISANVTIHTGSKISGAETAIGPGSIIGSRRFF